MLTTRLPHLLVFGLMAGLLLSGCKRRTRAADEAPPVAAAPEAPSMPPEKTVAPAPPPPASAPPPAVITQASNDAAYTQEMEQTLNDFLGDYIRAKKRIPRDINEMVSLKIITSIPPVPGGKQWVIDQRTGRISAR